MNTFYKIRWRIEKHLIDPLCNFYLKNRFYESPPGENRHENLFFTAKPKLKRFEPKRIFQYMISGSNMEALYEDDFDKAFSRGILNDPININQKELLRYRVYINALIANLAKAAGGDFCSVGVSWGIVPRTIYNYLDKNRFWESGQKYFLIDKYDQVLFASSSEKITQTNYCGDINFIKNEFKEDTFQIIQEYAPEAFLRIKKKISYLHLNTADKKSELETINLVYDKMTTPGFIVIDNYTHCNNKNSIDSFLKNKNNFVIPLGNSQGVIIKL